MIVRVGILKDLPAVMDMALLAMRESPRYGQYPPDLGRMRKLGLLTQDHPDFFMWVAEHDSELAGFLVGGVAESHFMKGRTAASIVLYVAPLYRGTRAAWYLLRQLVSTGRALGAAEVTVSSSTGIETEALERMALKQGFKKFGHTLVKAL